MKKPSTLLTENDGLLLVTEREIIGMRLSFYIENDLRYRIQSNNHLPTNYQDRQNLDTRIRSYIIIFVDKNNIDESYSKSI
jgi:hypothetical protein